MNSTRPLAIPIVGNVAHAVAEAIAIGNPDVEVDGYYLRGSLVRHLPTLRLMAAHGKGTDIGRACRHLAERIALAADLAGQPVCPASGQDRGAPLNPANPPVEITCPGCGRPGVDLAVVDGRVRVTDHEMLSEVERRELVRRDLVTARVDGGHS